MRACGHREDLSQQHCWGNKNSQHVSGERGEREEGWKKAITMGHTEPRPETNRENQAGEKLKRGSSYLERISKKGRASGGQRKKEEAAVQKQRGYWSKAIPFLRRGGDEEKKAERASVTGNLQGGKKGLVKGGCTQKN